MRTFVLFRRGPAPVLFAVCGLALTCSSLLDALDRSGQAPKTGAWPRVHIEDAFTRGAVEWALTGASLWLATERCRGVFSEFRYTQGRPLTERLETFGVDAQTYLTFLLFRDGSGTAPCADDMTFAVTTPRGRVVFVCGRRLERVWRASATRAQAVVIHEMLHSLGLGENPPASHEITERVLTLCDTTDNINSKPQKNQLPKRLLRTSWVEVAATFTPRHFGSRAAAAAAPNRKELGGASTSNSQKAQLPRRMLAPTG